MRIFNPDGSEAEMCGNGARCAAVFAYHKKIVRSRQIYFQTLSGPIKAFVKVSGARIGMGQPSGIELRKSIVVNNKIMAVSYINTGVPHTVLIRRDIDSLNIQELAPPIRYNRSFPKGTNVDFVRAVSRHRIKMRTYERGIEGETLACGTGAVAAATISSLLGYTKPPVEVMTCGGILKIHFERTTHPPKWARPRPRGAGNAQRTTVYGVQKITLEGEVRIVYEGEI